MTTAFAPQVAHTAVRISPAEALSDISAYLVAAAEDASLHPNALLTERGPITPSAVSSLGSVLLNLQRLEAGLQGKRLEAELDLAGDDGDENAVAQPHGSMNTAAVRIDEYEDAIRDDVARTPGGGFEADMDWQSRGEFEREQEDEAGDIDDDGAGAGVPTEDGGIVFPSKTERHKVEPVRTKRIDKEARKLAKKERRKQEKRDTNTQAKDSKDDNF